MSTPSLTLPSGDVERIAERDDIERLVGVILRSGNANGDDLPRIVVAIDGSEVSLALVDRIVEWLGHGWNLTIHLLCVHPFVAKEAAEKQLEANGLAQTASACTRLSESNTPYFLHLVMGNAAACIVRRATELGAAMILMGTGGHGSIGGALLGSVANRVVQDATIPVTLLRA